MPTMLEATSVVEFGGDLYTIGGYAYDGKGDSSEIYRLSCTSHVCTWNTINQVLKVARRFAVAISVPDAFCTTITNTSTTTTLTTTTTKTTSTITTGTTTTSTTTTTNGISSKKKLTTLTFFEKARSLMNCRNQVLKYF